MGFPFMRALAFLFPITLLGWEEGAYPILLPQDDWFRQSYLVDRFGTIQAACGPYVYPPLFDDNAETGWAIRRRDNRIVHVDREGKERFEVPEALGKVVQPWVTYANIAEGELFCRVEGDSLTGSRFVFLNHRNLPSRVYEGASMFINGRAVVRRDGWVYLLDHDYREVPVCRDVEGITVGEFWNGPYAVLVLRLPRSKVWDKERRREEWARRRLQRSRNRRSQGERTPSLAEKESFIPAIEDWPWPCDTVRILNRFGERVVEFPLVEDDGNLSMGVHFGKYTNLYRTIVLEYFSLIGI